MVLEGRGYDLPESNVRKRFGLDLGKQPIPRRWKAFSLRGSVHRKCEGGELSVAGWDFLTWMSHRGLGEFFRLHDPTPPGSACACFGAPARRLIHCTRKSPSVDRHICEHVSKTTPTTPAKPTTQTTPTPKQQHNNTTTAHPPHPPHTPQSVSLRVTFASHICETLEVSSWPISLEAPLGGAGSAGSARGCDTSG